MYARTSYVLSQPLTNIYTDSTQQQLQLQQKTQLQPQQQVFQYCLNNTNNDINYLGQPIIFSPSTQQLYVQPLPQQYILPQQHKPLIILPDNKYSLQQQQQHHQQQQHQQQQFNNIMQFQTTKKRPLQELQEDCKDSVNNLNNSFNNASNVDKDSNDSTNKISTFVDANIETKKQKLDDLLTEQPQKNSRSSIITCKGLPSNVSEAEVIQYFAPFGSVSGMILDPNKNTAQVEMTNEADVDKLLAHYHIRPPVLKGHVLRFYEGETTSSIKLLSCNQNLNNELLLQQQILQQHPLLQQQQLLQHQALLQQQHYYIQQAQQQKYLAIKQPLMLASNDILGSTLSSEFVPMTTPIEYTAPVAFNNNSLLNNVLVQHKQLLPLGNVLLVSNLNEEKVTPDALFILFGVYGDVTKVKVMYNKKDTALVQLSDPVMTQTALLNLDNLRLWDKVIKVAPSKHTAVQSPKDGAPDAGLTKDYTNSPLHRFKKPHSKNFSNIFPPSSTLHLSNVPNTTTKEHLTALFSQHGCVVGFKFFNNVVSANKECRMALMQMASVQEAAHALIALHNHQLAETIHLRVSFSKSSVLNDQQLQQQLLLTTEKTIQKQQSLQKQTEANDSKQNGENVEKEPATATPVATDNNNIKG